MKKIAAVLCGALIATSAICSATVAPDKIGIDKVVPGMTTETLISIYGQPVSRDGDDWIFQNFEVDIERGIVQEVVTRNNAVKTPAGVSVGQNAQVLSNIYGTADRVENEGNKSEYIYYSNDYSKKIEFKVRNGIITKISCEVRD